MTHNTRWLVRWSTIAVATTGHCTAWLAVLASTTSEDPMDAIVAVGAGLTAIAVVSLLHLQGNTRAEWSIGAGFTASTAWAISLML